MALAGCWPLLLAASALELAAYAPRHGLTSLSLWALVGFTTLLVWLGLGAVTGLGISIAARLGRSSPSALWSPAVAAAFVSAGALAGELPGRVGMAAALFLFSVTLWKFAEMAETRGWLGRSATAPLLALALAAILWSASRRSLVDTGDWAAQRAWVGLAVAGYLCLVLTSIVVGRGRVRPLVLLMLFAVVSLRGLVRNPADPLETSPAPRAPGVPVLLVVLDTLRSDALDLSDGRSPELARFAEKADVYPRAVANASWTLPAHASILSGLPVSQHRTDATSHPGLTPYLPAAIDTLTEQLATRGYRTTCVVANGIVGTATGLSQGCQEYENPGFYWLASTYPMRWAKRLARRTDWDPSQLVATLLGRTSYANAREITDRALSYLPKTSGEKASEEAPAYFLFVNYMDAHRPYASPPGTGLGQRLSYAFDQIRLLYGDLSFAEFREKRVETVRSDYRGQVPGIDRQVGRLLEAYESRGWLDEAVVIITSDHGQALWENDAIPAYFGHQGGFEPVVRIPLIAKKPRQTTGVVSPRRVQQSDLMPWVLGALSRESVSGIQAAERAVTEWYPRAARTIAPPVRQRVAIYDGPFKFVREEGGREWLFDVETSPFETENLLLAEPEVAERLRRLLMTNWAAPGTIDANGRVIEGDPADDPMIDDALKARLGALGYVR